MAGKRIQDNDTPRRLAQQAEQLEAVQRAWPLLSPFLKKLGVDVQQIQTALHENRELVGQIQELISLPDRFNALFAVRGFVAYDLLNMAAMREALQKGEAGLLDEAEQNLVDHYTPDHVRSHLQTMHAVQAFRPRLALACLTLEDYAAERYHACVPVVLALIDGLVNDVHPSRRGLSTEGLTLDAWDSVAAHDSGLSVLVREFQKTRQRVRSEPISFPYRNGILHGMDLGYGNKTVAAKAWALLFTVREWAVKAERGELEAPTPEPEPSFLDTLRQALLTHQNTQRTQQLIEAWQPRALTVGQHLPASGPPEAYAEGTPEERCAQFMRLWQSRNFGYMASMMPGAGDRGKGTPATKAEDVRHDFGDIELESFQLIQVDDTASAVTAIDVDVYGIYRGQKSVRRWKLRFIYLDEHGSVQPRSQLGGRWVLYTAWQLPDEPSSETPSQILD